jgi:hypothetical protein
VSAEREGTTTDDNLTAQIRQRMRERDTPSLLKIWRRADGEGWSDEAYEIVRQTLVERGVVLPNPSAKADVDSEPADDDGEDVYHSFDRLMGVASWSTSLSWLFLALAAVVLVVALFSVITNLVGPGRLDLVTLALNFAVLAGLALLFAFFFVLSQAISQVIYLLLDIEDNTRQPERANA